MKEFVRYRNTLVRMGQRGRLGPGRSGGAIARRLLTEPRRTTYLVANRRAVEAWVTGWVTLDMPNTFAGDSTKISVG